MSPNRTSVPTAVHSNCLNHSLCVGPGSLTFKAFLHRTNLVSEVSPAVAPAGDMRRGECGHGLNRHICLSLNDKNCAALCSKQVTPPCRGFSQTLRQVTALAWVAVKSRMLCSGAGLREPRAVGAPSGLPVGCGISAFYIMSFLLSPLRQDIALQL